MDNKLFLNKLMSTDVKVNQEGLLTLSQPILKVPLEAIKKQFRNTQKLIEREIQTIATRIIDLSSNGGNVEDLINRLKTLKSRVWECPDS